METVLHNRRSSVRWPVRLLARCLREDRRRPWETDVEVKDVHEDGLHLEHAAVEEGEPSAAAPHPGWNLIVRGFFYDERGDKAMEVRIRWVRSGPDGAWSAGAQFTGSGRSACFRDFLRVVRAESA